MPMLHENSTIYWTRMYECVIGIKSAFSVCYSLFRQIISINE